MNVLVLDLETTVQKIGPNKDDIDNSPYNPKNRIVSAHWRKVDSLSGTIGPANRSIFFHNDLLVRNDDGTLPGDGCLAEGPEALQQALDWADMVVAHNAKFDLMWLTEAGFKLPEKVYCTMIGEYVIARGVKVPLSLKATAIRRRVSEKKSDLTEEYWNKGIGFEAMPLAIVIEYADQDVLSCAQIYLAQREDFKRSAGLVNIITLMNDMLWFLLEIEHNGIKVDLDKLSEVEKEFKDELTQIEIDLERIVATVMGDTPINLRSGDDMSKVIYSREVSNKQLHKQIFNLGKDENGRDKYPPYMTTTQFNKAVSTTTRRVYRTVARQCNECHGHGFIRKFTIKGEPYKKTNICTSCGGAGMVYDRTDAIAGFRLIPDGPKDAAVGGFAVAKEQMSRLIAQAEEKGNDLAVEFLTKKRRLNALNTYLDSFVVGIQRWTRQDNLLHAGFNQTVTSTGRLSSSNPNFQNQPKNSKFPVRKCVISRFKGGYIIEADFSGLEFVVAGELSRDEQIIADILNGKDVHRQTASIVHQITPEEVTKLIRDAVKPHTFAPLYGATGANEPPHIKTYYEQFFNIYKRHGEWQKEKMDDVINTGVVVTPSGREYAFPGTTRIRGGKTTNSTKIVNYPVQGFATGDIVPLSCVRALRRFKELKLQSKLILTVHDSIVVDTHPDEKEAVRDALVWAMSSASEEVKTRWNYEMLLPLKCEVSIGPNWNELEKME